MATVRKYANLPDLDSAPDVYETTEPPSLIDDNSTIAASTTARSTSPTSAHDSDEESGISRRRLQPAAARTHFRSSRVDARNADFSDRVVRKQTYRTSSRRQRRTSEASDAVIGDSSDEEDESLERKVARLRVEIAEVKQEFARRKYESRGEGSKEKEEDDETDDEVKQMGDTLDDIHVQRRHGGVKGAEAQFQNTMKRFAIKSSGQAASGQAAPSTVPAQPAPPEAQSTSRGPSQLSAKRRKYVLARAAEFDTRLSSLETALGINGINMPDIGTDVPKPILHTLANLDRQISTISAASTDTLDPAFQRIHQLAQEAERLSTLRASAPGASDASSDTLTLGQQPLSQDPNSRPYLDDPERIAKINALYGTLATIEDLSPTLPLVLERLRTLRLVHQSADKASKVLDAMEKRQQEQVEEIKMWRGSLEDLEKRLEGDQKVLTDNIGAVGGRVRGLEERIERLGGV
ncbi:hypothetical protein H2201_000887 [Coniosporium apollinis]|uniref:Dynactin 2 n=1 Tax=Coniosporium apollinis TaxID=61459 RepID=A0ABQ9P383_9PEZI|nr:hypothetical protein H2201_000887 [Coniosporium apollinis]